MKLKFEFILAVFVLAIAAMLLVPLPTPLIDLLIVLNLAFSFLLLLISLYLPSALALLSFPTLLLLSTLFRLALNVASSRLILAQGDAGLVIEAFGTLLVGGQIAVGIIVFTIITVVNFLVIARGSARVSEVAARFALDALPGKQATIDSDLRAGLITTATAQSRRESLRKESQLYGAMDGAMKFVQGDAVAGFIIILTNIIGGLTIALGNGMPLAEAFQTYTILTVGDGLVAQVPALLIAICAGIVVTRVSSGDGVTLGEDVASDLLARPAVLVVVGCLLAVMAVLPGVPWMPFLAVGFFLAVIGVRLMTNAARSGVALGSTLSFKNIERAELPSGMPKLLPSNQLALTRSIASRSTGPGKSNLLGSQQSQAASSLLSVPPESVNARLRIMLDRHSLFSSLERSLDQAYARWADIQAVIEREFGVHLPELWIGADVKSPSGTVAVQLDGICIQTLHVPLDATVIALEPLHARALGFSVISECIEPLSGRALSWIGNSDAARREPFDKLDAVDIAMRTACQYLLANPAEIISIAQMHAALLELESSNPGLFDSSLDRRFINPARATEIRRELLRSGVSTGDTRQFIEDLAHYCATYAKSELTASDFDLADIVRHIRHLRARQLTAHLTDKQDYEAVAATFHINAGFDALDAGAPGIEAQLREGRIPIRSGCAPVVCVIADDSSLLKSRELLKDVLPSATLITDSEVRSAGVKTAIFAVWRNDTMTR